MHHQDGLQTRAISLYLKESILVGAPIIMDADALQLLLKGKMEEACQKMVAKNLYKYGLITKVPEFVLERDFIMHTSYAKKFKGDNIHFWVKMPFHLEYLTINKDALKHILAFMYRTKQFQCLFGEAAFYFQNQGYDSTAGNCEILPGALMHHITMVRSTSQVILKGLTKPDRLHVMSVCVCACFWPPVMDGVHCNARDTNL
jgi:hypothetical protein